MPVKPEVNTITKVTYFVMAFVVNDTGKKEIRHKIVKDDENKALDLANEWHKELQDFINDTIEIQVTQHIEIDKVILDLTNK